MNTTKTDEANNVQVLAFPNPLVPYVQVNGKQWDERELCDGLMELLRLRTQLADAQKQIDNLISENDGLTRLFNERGEQLVEERDMADRLSSELMSIHLKHGDKDNALRHSAALRAHKAIRQPTQDKGDK